MRPFLLFLTYAAYTSAAALQQRQDVMALTQMDASVFATPQEMEIEVERICSGGLRMPGSALHRAAEQYIHDQLAQIPGLQLSNYSYDLLGWEPVDGQTLQQAGSLMLGNETIAIASAVAYSLPNQTVTGELVTVPLGTNITAENAGGKIVVRQVDYPNEYPYSLVLVPSYWNSSDFNLTAPYKRPATAPTLLNDMVNAGPAGVLGVITVYDVAGHYMDSVFTPHDGTHYSVPGVFVGVDEGARLLAAAQTGGQTASIRVNAQVHNRTVHNMYAVLPGQSPEEIVYATHTDGSSHIQENGSSSLLALARYFAALPLSSRTRTLRFAFNTAHLHLSREGSDMLSKQLALDRDTNNVTLVIPIEHMASREIVQVPRNISALPGFDLEYTGEGEAMIWSVGPMEPVVNAAIAAAERRGLDKTLVTRGASFPQQVVVPEYTSFGGLGTYFHNQLLPTTSMISGPWSLWTPYFGASAVNYTRLVQQTLALGDIYFAIANATKLEILGEYADYRAAVNNGTKTPYQLYIPPENVTDVFYGP